MEITIKDIEDNLKTLPEELFRNVNDYIEFLKTKYLSNTNNMKTPEWQIEETERRVNYLRENPNTIVSEDEIAEYLSTLKDEL